MSFLGPPGSPGKRLSDSDCQQSQREHRLQQRRQWQRQQQQQQQQLLHHRQEPREKYVYLHEALCYSIRKGKGRDEDKTGHNRAYCTVIKQHFFTKDKYHVENTASKAMIWYTEKKNSNCAKNVFLKAFYYL